MRLAPNPIAFGAALLVMAMALIGLIPLVVIIILHLLIVVVLPVRWPAIRNQFRAELGRRLAEELDRVYLSIPSDVAAAIREERAQVEQFLTETKQVSEWLASRQQAARIAELYGN